MVKVITQMLKTIDTKGFVKINVRTANYKIFNYIQELNLKTEHLDNGLIKVTR